MFLLAPNLVSPLSSLFTALVGGTIGTFIPEVLGLGGTQINQIINATFSIEFLLLILFGKILMTSMCIGFGFFGGVFGPALFIGAALGGVLSGLLIKNWTACRLY